MPAGRGAVGATECLRSGGGYGDPLCAAPHTGVAQHHATKYFELVTNNTVEVDYINFRHKLTTDIQVNNILEKLMKSNDSDFLNNNIELSKTYTFALLSQKTINNKNNLINDLSPLNLALKNKGVRYLKLPYVLVFGLAWLLEKLAKLMRRGEPKLTMYGVGLLAHTQILNIDKAKRVLGYKPTYSLKYAVEKYLKWENDRA